MPSYNFKREAQLFVVDSGNRYLIDISSISFSQTFAEKSYPVKTLHAQTDYFEASIINRANVGNFSFEIPALQESDFTVLTSLLVSANSFDLYVSTPEDIFKLETCVITNGSFVIEKSRPLSIAFQGDVAKLTRGAILTGTLQDRSTTKSYIVNPKLDITIASASLTDVISVTAELQNNVSWTPYSTVQAARDVTSAANSMYPSGYVVSKKILSGSISQYLTDTNTSNVQTWSNSPSIEIRAGNGLSGSSFRGFLIAAASSTFTNRMGTGDVFVQNYDWRITDNSSSLTSILQYITN